MARFIPFILVLLVALGVFLVDPIRRAGEMIDPKAIPIVAQWSPPRIDGWFHSEGSSDSLPRAYPPHNAIKSETVAYVSGMVGLASEAYLRVVVAQDCRDLLAYEPSHSMLAGGWEPVDAEEAGGFWRTRHAHRSTLVDEVVVLETIFVAPGVWGSNPTITRPAHNPGPGWPGPAAVVQVLFVGSFGDNANAVRTEARHLAEQLAADLGGRSP